LVGSFEVSVIFGPSADELQKIFDVGYGLRSADVVLHRCRLVDVYSMEIREDCVVAISGKWIAAVSSGDEKRFVGSNTETIDAGGAFVLPGFIDAHTHADAITPIGTLAPACLLHGTTTLVTELVSVANAAGMAGLDWYFNECLSVPLSVFFLVPLISHLYGRDRDGGPVLKKEDLEHLLGYPGVVGVGECYWKDALENDVIKGIVRHTRGLGMTADGHATGAKADDLAAYAAMGIRGDHESLKTSEALARIRLGLYALIREGSKRGDLSPVIGHWPPGIPGDHLVLVTDTMLPQDIRKTGYMDHLVRQLVGLGRDPIDAICMATKNTAQYLCAEHVVGSVTPGKLANILIVPDLRTMSLDTVLSVGVQVVRKGELLIGEGEVSGGFPRLSRLQFVHESDLTPSIPVQGRFRAARMSRPTLTHESEVVLSRPEKEGFLSPETNLCYMAVVSRHDSAQRFVGLVENFGLKEGAMANSINFDESALCSIGPDIQSVLAALNRMIDLGGGIVLAHGSDIVDQLALPIAGVQSEDKFGRIADFLEGVPKILAQWGCKWPDPIYSMRTLTFTGIPELRLTTRGYYHVKGRRDLPLAV
jgi:adenine deaminase